MNRLILLVLLTLPVIISDNGRAAQEAQNPKLEIYTFWNKNLASLKVEGDYASGKWRELYDSLRADPPEMVRSLDREQILQDLIRLHKERTGYLESMLKLERDH